MDIEQILAKTSATLEPLQPYFLPSSNNNTASLLPILLHRALPRSFHQVVLLEPLLKFKSDIAKLHELFGSFHRENLIGAAFDLHPGYRQRLEQYRRDHYNTRIGSPGPNGLPGFNSGVLLMDLDKMRASALYNTLLKPSNAEKLTSEFHVEGFLGAQDFVTLAGMKYEWFFYVVPCQWNRQKCPEIEMGNEIKRDELKQYYNCPGKVKVHNFKCNRVVQKH